MTKQIASDLAGPAKDVPTIPAGSNAPTRKGGRVFPFRRTRASSATPTIPKSSTEKSGEYSPYNAFKHLYEEMQKSADVSNAIQGVADFTKENWKPALRLGLAGGIAGAVMPQSAQVGESGEEYKKRSRRRMIIMSLLGSGLGVALNKYINSRSPKAHAAAAAQAGIDGLKNLTQ